jgi:hypothetical protein
MFGPISAATGIDKRPLLASDTVQSAVSTTITISTVKRHTLVSRVTPQNNRMRVDTRGIGWSYRLGSARWQQTGACRFSLLQPFK